MADLEILLYNKVELDDGSQGVVRYIGNVMGKKGTYYGIDITEGESKNDGTINNVKYFKTKHGKFCKKAKIIKSKTTNHSKYPFKIGDVVMCTKTNCKGKVRYIGIPSWATGSKVYYGLDLKKQRGTCNGTYKNIQYFQAKMQYGIYVPSTMVKPVPIRKNTNDEMKENKTAESINMPTQLEIVKSKSHNGDSIIDNMSSMMEAKTDYKLLLLVNVSRIIPIMAAIFAVAYIIYLLAKTDNWSTDPTSPDAEILRREASRGLFVSVVIAILMNLVGALMFYIKVRESLVVVNYGFILAPVTGFLLDQSVGTDAGFRDFMTAAGFSYTFASLIGGNFMRYIITVFLDLFISNPLQDILKTQIAKIGVLKVLKDTRSMTGTEKNEILRRYDAFVAMNYPSILQSIVAFVTFNAYTNQTRFAWAYPNIDLDRELRIPPGTIMLGTATAGILYLCFYTIMDYISDRDYFDINTKLGYVLVILALLYGLNLTESIEAPVQDEIDTVYTKSIHSAKPYLGMLMYTFFVLYGCVYPIFTRVGCCGKCKSQVKEFELDKIDHLAEVDHKVVLTSQMIEEIKRQLIIQRQPVGKKKKKKKKKKSNRL